MARRVAFIRTMSKYRHHSVHTAPSTGSGTGIVWNDRDFCLQRDFSKGSIQMCGRDWRGGRKPVPAGVRSATRGMEPKGGTPESA